ncbi:MAG: peptidoglycan bridge formation glycyltransferase FemA/FemB family protein, partial [Candidatus Limnocylindrales bacterium]
MPASPDAWDAFVEEADPGSYLQLAAWANVKASNGWSASRFIADTPSGPMGAQVLLRRPRVLPWAVAYAPRGPVTAAGWDPASIPAFTEATRDAMRTAGRVSHLRIDPEIEADGPFDPDGALRRALRASGWRPAPAVQPASTRMIDLRPDEATLLGDLRKKWRQYVNRARTAGVTVEDADADSLSIFYAIYRETATRAGFVIRTEQTYRGIWEAFRPQGRARLLIARLPDGEPAAALFLIRC